MLAELETDEDFQKMSDNEQVLQMNQFFEYGTCPIPNVSLTVYLVFHTF